MGLLVYLGVVSQVALLTAAASSHVVTDPYIATHWNACPPACDSVNPNDWSFYPDWRILKTCQKPMLLNLAVNNPSGGPEDRQTLYACTRSTDGHFGDPTTPIPGASSPAQYATRNVQVETAWRGENASQYASHIEAAAQLVQDQLNSPVSRNATIALGYSNGIALGAFFGSKMEKSEDRSILKSFLDKLRSGELSKSGAIMQVCNSNRSAAHILGVVSEAKADPAEALSAIQEALATWNRGKCIQGYSGSSQSELSVGEAKAESTVFTETQHRGSSHGKRSLWSLHRRGDCKTIQVKEGDDCGKLATRCEISPAKFTKYNPSKTLCSSLLAGQHVCCSAGTLPDFSPKPNKDGTCAVHTVQNNDDCSKIAGENSISKGDIDDWNQKTWAWMGCSSLQVGGKICISKGDPPMPSVLKNAVCGPQKAGTKRPHDWDDIEGLNPCPLNACCNIWGQCGTTNEFCKATNSSTGAPGTAKNGTNGCISNCGTDIVFDDSGFPDKPVMIGYYEAFQNKRPCLNLDVSAINKTIMFGGQGGGHSSLFEQTWDHIHFAFANITEDFEVDVSDVKKEFDQFTKYSSPGKKPKVLSFGGWAFSTEANTYAIFRKGVTDDERSKFASNVAQFAEDHDLDGLDFDWEYPGAPDLPDVPPSDPDDGDRYLQFLKEVRHKLSAEKTLSIAAPSSYWYLKGFPIQKISTVVDYIVYMTYDLHGQWDYDKPHAAEGCDGGSCLRSHVNLTEIENSLSIITKAGVPNSKIVAGLASYGRSFGMADPSCSGPECKFTGPESGAMAGECTKTRGYIAEAEIKKWLESSDNIKTRYDEVSHSTISYSSNGTWVAYSDGSERNQRMTDWWYNRTVLGTSLWALDLTDFVVELPDGTALEPFQMIECTESFDNLDDLESATGINDYCMNTYMMQALHGNLTKSVDRYQDVLDNDYDQKFGWYKEAVRHSAPGSLESFLKKHASKYFDCTCMQLGSNGLYLPGAKNKTCECPHNPHEGASYHYWWAAKDKDQFETDLLKTAGISSDWLMYVAGGAHCEVHMHTPTVCGGSVADGMPSLKEDYQISNPKQVISQRLPNIKSFRDQLDFIAMLSANDAYLGDTSDVVEGASMLALMLSSSVSSMKQVAAIGKKYEDEKIKEIILLFVTSILLIIPGVGEIAEAADLAVLAVTLRVIGEAGDAGLAVYDIVSSKEVGPAVIFGAILGGLGALDMLRAPSLFSKAAGARRGMSAKYVETLGSEVHGGSNQVEKLIKRCY